MARKKRIQNPLPSVWTDAHVRINRKGQLQVALNPAKLGSGARFAACVRSVAAKGSAYDRDLDSIPPVRQERL